MLRPRKLGHVGIYVKDLERTTKFYTEVVGLKVSDEFQGKAVFMRCSHDHHDTVAFQLPQEKLERAGNDRSEIQQIAYEVDRIEVEFRDPDGNKVQFYCDMEQIGWDDRSRPPELWRPDKNL